MSLKIELLKKVDRITNLELRPSKVAGGHALFYKNKEIAHFHNNNEIDVRLTRKVIRSQGLVHPTGSKFHHHRNPQSDWIEIRFRRKEHLDEILRLIKLAIKQY